MQDYVGVEPWPYLDKLICQWRAVEEETRSACNLDPAPPYGRCRLFRGQTPTAEWTQEADFANGSVIVPATPAPAAPPSTEVFYTPAPVVPVISNSSIVFSVNNGNPADVFNSPPVAAPVADPAATGGWLPGADVPVTPEVPPPVATPEVPPPVATPEVPPPAVPANGFNPGDCQAVSSDRLCVSDDPCCESQRSDTDFCWDMYENVYPGDEIFGACSTCCPSPKSVGPPNPPHPKGIDKTIMCSDLDSVQRVCKNDSCCSNPRSNSAYCQGVYAQYGNDIDQICVSVLELRFLSHLPLTSFFCFLLSR
jgi:hypothetical protein